jgi:hypothetical protein
MDQSDSTTQHKREVGASPPTQRSSPLGQPFHEPTHFNPLHQTTMPLGQEPPQPINEITPIVSHNSAQQRRYHSTENVLRDGNAGPIKSPSIRGLKHPNQQNSRVVVSEEPQASWLSRVADRYGSLELENKGSVARDHLALGASCFDLIIHPLQ